MRDTSNISTSLQALLNNQGWTVDTPDDGYTYIMNVFGECIGSSEHGLTSALYDARMNEWLLRFN